MKKITALFLAICILLSFAACGQSGAQSTGGGSSSVSSETIGVSDQVASLPTPLPDPTFQPPTAPPAQREWTQHDWSSEETLYPMAVGAQPLNAKVFVDEQRLLLKENGLLRILDLVTGEITVPCQSLDCTHDTQDCSAYQPGGIAFLAQGKLYRISRDPEGFSKLKGSLQPYPESVVTVENSDGTGRREVGRIYGENDPEYGSSYYIVSYGDKIYIFSLVDALWQDGSPVQGTTNDRTQRGNVVITPLDPVVDTLGENAVAFEIGKNGTDREEYLSLWVTGAYGGGIYFLVQYWNDMGDFYFNYSDLDDRYWGWIADAVKLQYFRYDLASGQVEIRDDGYPDEYKGVILEDFQKITTTNRPARDDIYRDYHIDFPSIYRPSVILGDWLVYYDDSLMVVDLQTGEERMIFKGEVSDICATENQVNLVGTALYFRTGEGTTCIYDLETGESQQIALVDGNLYEVLGENENSIFATLEDQGPVVEIDISSGYRNCPYQVIE